MKKKIHCKLLFFSISKFLAECQCDIRGIVSNDGCDQQTGECACKRNVINQNCDQCAEEHYGLSESDPDGCQPCQCDIGGAYDNNCDIGIVSY